MKYEGVKGLRYEQDYKSFNGFDNCFCTKQIRNLTGSVECLPFGLNDVFNCFRKFFYFDPITQKAKKKIDLKSFTEAPIVLSRPHLLEVDNDYRNTVDGLKPNESVHSTFIDIEPVSIFYPSSEIPFCYYLILNRILVRHCVVQNVLNST